MEREKLIKVVTAAQKGDEKALNQLFNAYYNDVYYFALKTVKDEELACDITQETFVRIIETIGTLKEPAAFVTWMKQIAYHNCLGYFKKKKDILVDEDEDGGSVFDILEEDRAEFIPDEALDQQDFRRTILAMLDKLSPEQRSATMLYYYDEMSVRQIAQIQGVSEGTVKSRLNYARKAIKASVEEYEKKNNVKLHSLGLFPLIAWLFSGGQAVMSGAAAAGVAVGISSATGTAIAVSGGTVAAAVTLVAKVVGAVLASLAISGICVAVTLQPDPDIPEETEVIFVETTEALLRETVKEEVQQTEPEETISTEAEETIPTETEPKEAGTEETGYVPKAPEETVQAETNPAETEPTEKPDSVPVVPAGCTYVLADGTELQPGEAMPDKVSDGDKFITADYTYEYTYGLMTSYTKYGWSVTVKDTTKTAYEPLLAEINGEPLVSLAFAFMGCRNMTTAPAIPSSVVTLDRAFHSCGSLTQAPAIPAGVSNLSQAFAHCISLQTAPKLPAGVTNLWQAFYDCESLTAAPEIPSGVTDLYETFTYCINLQTAPQIPEGVTTMNRTFAECWSLTTAPVIPASVTLLQGTFSGCSSLSGEVVIHANPAHYSQCFSGTRNPIVLTGSSTVLAELAATADNGNVTF